MKEWLIFFSSAMSSKYKVVESCTLVTMHIHLEEDTIFNKQFCPSLVYPGLYRYSHCSQQCGYK